MLKTVKSSGNVSSRLRIKKNIITTENQKFLASRVYKIMRSGPQASPSLNEIGKLLFSF